MLHGLILGHCLPDSERYKVWTQSQLHLNVVEKSYTKWGSDCTPHATGTAPRESEFLAYLCWALSILKWESRVIGETIKRGPENSKCGLGLSAVNLWWWNLKKCRHLVLLTNNSKKKGLGESLKSKIRRITLWIHSTPINSGQTWYPAYSLSASAAETGDPWRKMANFLAVFVSSGFSESFCFSEQDGKWSRKTFTLNLLSPRNCTKCIPHMQTCTHTAYMCACKNTQIFGHFSDAPLFKEIKYRGWVNRRASLCVLFLVTKPDCNPQWPETPWVSQTALKCMSIFLVQSPKCWDYRWTTTSG